MPWSWRSNYDDLEGRWRQCRERLTGRVKAVVHRAKREFALISPEFEARLENRGRIGSMLCALSEGNAGKRHLRPSN
jgi:hypothetical protein